MGAHHSLDERAEVVAVRARHVVGVGELLYQVLPGAVVELPAIERLQRELARHAARAAELLRLGVHGATSARHRDVPAAAGGERRAETALLARRGEHRDRTSDANPIITAA